MLSFLRIIKFAFQNFFRNFWLSIVTVTILILTLFSVTFLLVFNVVADTAIASVEEKIDVSVYFYPEVSEKQITEVKTDIDNLSQVKGTTYISRDEAIASFKKEHEGDEVILESLDELETNPLGATLVVQAHETDQYQSILRVIDQPFYAKLVQDRSFDNHESIISRISLITNRVRGIGIIMFLVFAFIAILVVYNTIRVAIFIHKEEVGIMRLVGATGWFIRAPFLVEGVIYSMLGVLGVIAIIYPILGFLQPYFGTFFGASNFDIVSYFNTNFVWIFGLELAGAILLNMFTTSLALRKYLRV